VTILNTKTLQTAQPFGNYSSVLCSYSPPPRPRKHKYSRNTCSATGYLLHEIFFQETNVWRTKHAIDNW